MREMELVVLAGVGDAEALGKTIAEVVGSTALECDAVVHHWLNGVGRFRAGKFFLLGLLTDDRRNRECLGVEIAVDVQHTQGLLLRFFRSGVHGVTFLPEKFGGAQEGTGGLFPADDRAPLIVKLGQVAVGIDDLLVMLAEQGLRGRTDSQTLVELFLTADRHPCAFGRKALNVVFLALQETFGNEHRHVDVLVTGLLEAAVKVSLHELPDRVTVGADHHAALYAGIVNQFRLFDDIGIPFCKILVAAGNRLDHFFIFSHDTLLRWIDFLS